MFHTGQPLGIPRLVKHQPLFVAFETTCVLSQSLVLHKSTSKFRINQQNISVVNDGTSDNLLAASLIKGIEEELN